MNKKLILFCAIALSLSVNVGCQNNKDTRVDKNINITETIDKNDAIAKENELIKFKSDIIDFSKVAYESSETRRDKDLEKAIVEYLDYREDYGDLVYYYNNVDLNGDDKKEIFVYLIGEYVSGTGGSTALIIESENYNVISDFTLVNNPIIISDEKTNMWNDIVMRVSGGGAEPSYVQIKFDGEKYPSNPSILSKIEENSIVEGLGIIANKVSIEDGIKIETID